MVRSLSRPLLALAALAVLSPVARLPLARADDLPDDQMSPFQFSAVLDADNVYLRAGPGESMSDYPVVKLSKGQALTVVGNHGDWLKVLPTDDVYCMVGKPWIERRGDSTVGRVTADATNATVRVASQLSTDYGRIATTLRPGQDVKVLGEREEYYKIAPPPGAFLFVHRRFVQLVKRVDVASDGGQLTVKSADDVPSNGDTPTKPVTPPSQLAETPATKPADVAMNPPTPATQPTATASVQQDFDAAEAKFLAASRQPLGEQPIDAMAADYEKVKADPTADKTMRQVAEFRLKVLGVRRDAAAALATTDAARKQRDAEQVSMAAEAKEMTDKIAANQFKRYTAVGVLRPSSLPFGGKTLYRLTDPANGRTVVYVATNDAKVTAMDGSFVGLRGTVSDDSTRQIKLLTPESAEAIDPVEVTGGTVTSTMIPASMQTSLSSVR